MIVFNAEELVSGPQHSKNSVVDLLSLLISEPAVLSKKKGNVQIISHSRNKAFINAH